MTQRRILDNEVQQVLLGPEAEVIAAYPHDKYSPSGLICGLTAAGRMLHVQANHAAVIVTVYDPDPAEWIDRGRRRKR